MTRKTSPPRPALPLLLMALALLASCGPRGEGPLVLAAASLQGPLDRAADAWVAKGHARPALSYAGTPALARQVEAGAPADLFVSADTEWMDELAERGLVRADSRATLARNELVVIDRRSGPVPPPGSGVAIRMALDGTERIAVADPDSVPAGRYAKAALERLGLWSRVRPRLVPTENVRAALALVERGAVPLGIVYATDARESATVGVAGAFPSGSHPPILYPIARTTTSTHPEADGFRRFLLGPDGQAILRRAGFRSP